MAAIAKFVSTVAVAKAICENEAVVCIPNSTVTPVVSYGGLPGPAGASGTQDIIATTNENVSALRVMSRVSGGGVEPTDPSDMSSVRNVVGLALNAATAGFSVTIKRFGYVQDASYNFTPGEPVFLAIDGTVGQIANSGVAVLKLGGAVSNTAFELKLSPLVKLS